MRTPLVVGNWKMHGTQDEARELAQAIRDGLKRPRGVEVAVCPPFTALAAVAEVLAGAAVALGAQNCHWEAQGAFTGEISPAMLAELGCRWVLVGHSERRHVFRETDEEINRKVVAALRHGLRPVLCVGETDEERRQGLTFTVVEGQLRAGWAGLSADDLARCVLAYEPVWAIGTGVNATPAQAAEVHGYLRGLVSELASKELAQSDADPVRRQRQARQRRGAHPGAGHRRRPGGRRQSPGARLHHHREEVRRPERRFEGVEPTMFILVVIVHVIVCLVIVGLVLLQAGKGADIGSAFGGSGSQAVFGSMGTPTVLGKATSVVAIVFMADLVRPGDDGAQAGGERSCPRRAATAPRPRPRRRRPRPPPSRPRPRSSRRRNAEPSRARSRPAGLGRRSRSRGGLQRPDRAAARTRARPPARPPTATPSSRPPSATSAG